jgi:glycerol-3-phosphate acyltransferase PlsX
VRIALDAMGGDFAPRATVEGAVMVARDLGLEVALVGDKEKVERELSEHATAGLKLTVVHAAETVTMDDSPIESLLYKLDSSIHRCFELYKQGEVDALVSAGNSGAVMAAGMAILGTLPGVERPAIASTVPSGDSFALLLDAGANVEVKPHHLAQFAAMGTVYWRHVANVANPRVGILANGEEETKGTELTRAAAALLRQMGERINYIGYVEGRDINNHKADVIVTDGFTGNVALKTMEGFADFVVGHVRGLFGTNMRGRLAFLLIRRQFVAMRRALDKSEYGGAPLLGINGVAFVAHGSSSARAIRNALRVAAHEGVVKQVNQELVELIREIPAQARVKASSKGFRSLFSRMRERLHRHPRLDGAKSGELGGLTNHDHATGDNHALGSTPAQGLSEQATSVHSATDGRLTNYRSAPSRSAGDESGTKRRTERTNPQDQDAGSRPSSETERS